MFLSKGHIALKSLKVLLFEITPYPLCEFFMHIQCVVNSECELKGKYSICLNKTSVAHGPSFCWDKHLVLQNSGRWYVMELHTINTQFLGILRELLNSTFKTSFYPHAFQSTRFQAYIQKRLIRMQRAPRGVTLYFLKGKV